MAYAQKELWDTFKKLPQDVQEAAMSVDFMQVMDEVGKKHSLHVDQLGKLSGETFQLMLGLTHPEEFVGKIEKSVNMPPEIAKQIGEEINTKIFRPIRASLMRIHKMMEEKEEAQEENGGEESAPSPEVPVEIKEPEAKAAEPAKLPAEKTSVNIAEEKLKASFTIPKKESGYAGKDPYHEDVA